MILDHVQIAMPAGREQEARAFFADVLGMVEEEKPSRLRSRGGCWFRSGRCVVHLGVDPDFRPQRKAHPAFVVPDLRGLAHRLESMGFEVAWDSEIVGVERFYTTDPFGNRLEFIEEGKGLSQKHGGQFGGRTDEASRMIQAPPAAIYRAFQNPQALEAWLPPTGMTGRMQAFDFRDGGLYRMRLTYAAPAHGPGKTSADSDDVEVRFVRLVENESIEQAVTFDSHDPGFSGVMKVTWTFTPVASGTMVRVRCDNVPDGIGRADHEAGLRSSLENLAKFVE